MPVQYTGFNNDFVGLYNVLDYGAVGNGTTDDTSAIQAAATAAAGGTLYFPPDKTYLLTGFTVGANTLIEGNGATLKQDILDANDGTPMISVRGDNITIRNIKFNGQAGSQPADGFNDSYHNSVGYDTGTGRAYRAAIDMNAFVYSLTGGLVVDGCEFTANYGACVATLDASNIVIRDCYAYSTFFELAFLARRTTEVVLLTGAQIVNNRWRTLTANSGSVEPNGLLVSVYDGVVITGNNGYDCYRDHVKITDCHRVNISDNIFDTNNVIGGGAIQVQEGILAIQYHHVFSDNVIRNCAKGIDVSAPVQTLSITGNVIDTTTASSEGDGILIGAGSTQVTVSGNSLRNINRMSIYCGGASDISITGNTCNSDAPNQAAIYLYALLSDMDNVTVVGNTMTGWTTTDNGAAAITFSRESTYVFHNIIIAHNVAIGGGSARKWFSCGADVATGVVMGNWSDGYAANSATGLIFRDNYQPGSNSLTVGAARLPEHLTGTATWDIGTLADGASATKDVTVTGAAVGDVVNVGMRLAEGGTDYTGAFIVSGRVRTANTVTVTVTNHSAAEVNPDSVTVRCDVWSH